MIKGVVECCRSRAASSQAVGVSCSSVVLLTCSQEPCVVVAGPSIHCFEWCWLQGGLEVQIKWPNDIYYSGVKIGGALIHTTFAGTQQFCVLTGIGLNVSNSQPTTCLDDIIQARLQQQQGQQSQQQQPARVCKEQLLASVLSHLEACFDTFQSQGFDPLQPLYLSAWMHSNQVVELEEGGGDGGGVGQSGQRVRLTLVGLSPHGFLLGKDAQGAEYELTPDGNSFDMMQGLIKRKL